MMPFIKKYYIGLIVVFLGFFTTLWAFYPGFLSPDSVEQYTQAVTRNYNDTQPPVMSFLWTIFNVFWNGPQPMLIFHLSCYWLSFFIFYITFKQQNAFLSLYFLIIPFAPFLLNFVGVIWKDVSFAVTWILGFSIIFNRYVKQEKIKHTHLIIVILLILYGGLSRYNSYVSLPFFAALLVYLYIVTNNIKIKFPFRFIVAISMIITVGFLLINTFLNSLVEKRYNQQGIMLDDICAIYRNDKKDYFPDYIRNQSSFGKFLDDIKYVEIATIDQGVKRDNITHKKENFNELRGNWISAIKNNPSTYIKFRFHLFYNNFLRIDSEPFYASNFWFAENDYGLKFSGNEFLYKKYSAYILKAIDNSAFLFKQYFWLLFNIAILILLFLLGKKLPKPVFLSLALILIASLSYISGYIVWQPCADLRFIYFSVFSIIVSIGIILNTIFFNRSKIINT